MKSCGMTVAVVFIVKQQPLLMKIYLMWLIWSTILVQTEISHQRIDRHEIRGTFMFPRWCLRVTWGWPWCLPVTWGWPFWYLTVCHDCLYRCSWSPEDGTPWLWWPSDFYTSTTVFTYKVEYPKNYLMDWHTIWSRHSWSPEDKSQWL